MVDTVPLPETPAPSARHMHQRHRVLLALIVGVLALALLAFGWSIYSRQRAAIWWNLSTQAEQLQLALNANLDVARKHVAGMRQTTERNLRQPILMDSGLTERLERRNLAPLRDAPWDRLPQDLVKEVGAVHVDPSAGTDSNAYRRDLPAPLGALAQVSAAHAQLPSLQWSYFYDANKQWRWVYPAQARDDVLTATGKPDMAGALAAMWDAAGTTPLDAAGPTRNPSKELVWTSAHLDPLKKAPVVSVLAPVYVGTSYVGLVGADMAVDALHNTVLQHTLPIGQTWLVDGQGQVLVGSHTGVPPAGPYTTETGWLRLALRGTDWTLLVHAPNAVLARAALDKMLPLLALGLVALLAVAASCIALSRQFTRPALQLADYVLQTSGPSVKRPPPVPALWKPWFDKVAMGALQRRDQMHGAHQRTTQLELQLSQHATEQRAKQAEHDAQLAARADELRSVYAQLSAALADVQTAQSAAKKTTAPKPALPE